MRLFHDRLRFRLAHSQSACYFHMRQSNNTNPGIQGLRQGFTDLRSHNSDKPGEVHRCGFREGDSQTRAQQAWQVRLGIYAHSSDMPGEVHGAKSA